MAKKRKQFRKSSIPVSKKSKRPGRPVSTASGSKPILDYFAWWYKKQFPEKETTGFSYAVGDVKINGWSFEETGIPVSKPVQLTSFTGLADEDNYLLVQGDKGIDFIPWPNHLTKDEVMVYNNWQKNIEGFSVGKEIHKQTMEVD